MQFKMNGMGFPMSLHTIKLVMTWGVLKHLPWGHVCTCTHLYMWVKYTTRVFLGKKQYMLEKPVYA